MKFPSSPVVLLGMLWGLLSVNTTTSKAQTAPAAGSKSPNILFILSDQFRQDCVGATGNRDIHTPNLDRLAREGVLFNRFYVAQPVCSPTRASILTGLYPHSAGVSENNTSLPRTSTTLAEMLTPAGYDCGYFGKWHLERRDPFPTFPEYPNDGRGNNHYYGKGAEKRYSVDVVTDDAIKFIRRPRNQPFYAYVSYYPPHPPFSVPAEYEQRYKGIADSEKRLYYAMCTKVDEGVGQLLKTLDDAGLADNTLVIFNSDHGHNLVYRWNKHYKRLCYDTSARVPLIVRMPGVVRAGRQSDALLSSVDLVPTMLSLIGKPIPSGLQGRDFSDLVRGQTDKGRDYVFIENVPFTNAPEKGEERCVLNSQWKLILSTRRPPELYEYKVDSKEANNRWAEMKDAPVVADLLKQLGNWATETRDALAPELIKAVRGVK
jgi:arylsulfatase A-like enzyme